jgi:hypothetical protein
VVDVSRCACHATRMPLDKLKSLAFYALAAAATAALSAITPDTLAALELPTYVQHVVMLTVGAALAHLRKPADAKALRDAAPPTERSQ